MMAVVLPFSGFRVRCANCFRWMRRRLPANEPAYCSYVCGALGQPEHCASSWGWTQTDPRT